MKKPHSTTPLQKLIIQEASQCIRCGLCLNHCPTYMLTQNECESPRGRIALMQNLAQQELELTPKTKQYLDHCLTCRACENVCPAKVNYGSLIDHGRQYIHSLTPKANLPRFMNFLITSPKALTFLVKLLRIYQKSGLQFILRKLQLLTLFRLKRIDSYLPIIKKQTQFKTFYQATTKEQGRVALFLGCIVKNFDVNTLRDSIKVLTACGYSVIIPAQQNCCGALHLHAGQQQIAHRFIQNNIKLFKQQAVDAVITTATGCQVVLQEHAANLSVKFKDINQFLLEIDWPKNLNFNPLPQKVLIHTPCTQRHVLHLAQTTTQLLNKIPEIEIIPLDYPHCCGAAGAYMLEHATMADALVDKLYALIKNIDMAYFVTTNIGCQLHIKRKFTTEKRAKISIIHPISLLASQISLKK